MVPPSGFSLNEQTGQYYSPEDGGLYWDPSTGKFYSVRRNATSDSRTFGEPEAANGPAPSALADANALVEAYQRLPTNERIRLLLLIDEVEQSFDRAVLRRLEFALEQARVNKFDKAAYDRYIGGFDPDRTVYDERAVPPVRTLGRANGRAGTIRGARRR